MTLKEILKQYNIHSEVQFAPIQEGLINHSWKITTGEKHYLLQKVNDKIFPRPFDIANNIDNISKYLNDTVPSYLFISPLATNNGETLIYKQEDGYYRLFLFVENSKTINVVHTPQQAYEAAAQFGKFTKQLSGFDAKTLKITLPNFHNLGLRYRQFNEALKNGNKERINECNPLVADIKRNAAIVEEYENICRHKNFKQRVTHHDTKISNVLFDENSKGLCVIDLDTVMPGYFISDVGDMMRTYLCSVNEEEANLTKVHVRPDYYKAIVNGYLDEMKDELSLAEQSSFYFAGKFMIYMQALRFLTDYFNNDVYYKTNYSFQNKIRAANQLALLKSFESLNQV